MSAFSVILTTCNNAAVLPNALCSLEEAVAFLRSSHIPISGAPAEVVVVDDGSTDGTADVVREATRGKDLYRAIRHPRPANPACARNAEVVASRGQMLLFAGIDHLYLPHHLHEADGDQAREA
jgi:glycosyltransferase involved in cell wall biosynthesis